MKQILALTVVLLCATPVTAQTLVGSFDVTDGPQWDTNPPTYSAVEACALLFGGVAADYAGSTSSTEINNQAWLDGWGDSQYCFTPSSDTFKLNTTYDCGTTGCSYSAYVSDHTGDCAAKTNYCWLVAGSADLTITKAGGDGVNAGGQTQYLITVTNEGPSDAQNVVMEDVLPPGTTFVDITEPAGFTCVTPAVGATGTVTCTAATLAADATAQFTLTVQIDPNLTSGTVIENTATVTSTTTDPTPLNNAATVTQRAMVPGIPTVSELGLLAMMMALAAFGALQLRS